MVSRSITFAFGFLVVALTARAELSLTPLVEDYDMDGVRMQHLVFLDGANRITYNSPPGWKYSGSNARFTLYPPPAGSEASITRRKLEIEETFDDETTKRLTNEVLAAVPGGATNVAIVSQEKNPLKIEGKETYLVIVKFEFYGDFRMRSVMFLDRKGEQLRFELTAATPDFARLQEVFRASQFSFQNL